MKTYTIEELTALSDADLNALAAELRGWHVALGAVDTLAGETVHEHHWEGRGNEGELGAIISLLDWQPATDRNQSGELLEWAAANVIFQSGFGQFQGGTVISPHIIVLTLDGRSIRVPGNTARSETIAFCAAMLAIQNAQGGASE